MESTKMFHTISNKYAQVSKPLVEYMCLGPRRGVSYHGGKIKAIMRTSMNSNTLSLSLPTIERRSASYKPSIWSFEYLETLRRGHVNLSDEYEKIERLKAKVKNIVADEALEFTMLLQLIDEIQRLGLENHFKEDIENALSKLGRDFDDLEWDLQSTALGFRLLRQSGVLVSQDVFKKFMDKKGINFLPSLRNDLKGMIQLYEASYLGFEGEHILNEAKAFTTKHLNTMCLINQDTLIFDDVNHSLDLPLRYRLPRLEARDNIESNSRIKEDTKNGTTLLELAKLDYNLKLSMHQEDLREMARWWKDLGLANNLSFARDRLMECFFWGVSTTPAPELYSCRKALTKVYNFITIIDDIYDVYGQLHELELFTNAIERWNINNVIEDLPDYMKLTYFALYNTINEIGYEILKQKGHNCVPFLKKAWEHMCKAFLVEAKWCHNKETPTFKEYINNGWVSISGILALTHAFFYVSPNITQEALQCLENNHDVLRLPAMVFRLANDLATSEAEIERGETANAITCYAKQEGISHKEARDHITKMIEESWKGLNQIQVANNTPFSKDFIQTAMNLARTSQCAYQHGDGHSSPELLKKKILSMIIEPIH